MHDSFSQKGAEAGFRGPAGYVAAAGRAFPEPAPYTPFAYGNAMLGPHAPQMGFTAGGMMPAAPVAGGGLPVVCIFSYLSVT